MKLPSCSSHITKVAAHITSKQHRQKQDEFSHALYNSETACSFLPLVFWANINMISLWLLQEKFHIWERNRSHLVNNHFLHSSTKWISRLQWPRYPKTQTKPTPLWPFFCSSHYSVHKLVSPLFCSIKNLY